jgi:hypothetical protein
LFLTVCDRRHTGDQYCKCTGDVHNGYAIDPKQVHNETTGWTMNNELSETVDVRFNPLGSTRADTLRGQTQRRRRRQPQPQI